MTGNTDKKIKRWVWLLIIAVVAVLLASVLVYRFARNFEARLLEHMAARDATAIVIHKEYVKYDKTNRYRIGDDGQRIEMQPGDEAWLIYYQIKDFEGISQELRDQIMEAEKNRIANGKTRSRIITKAQYERIKEGDQLHVVWRWLGDNSIEILNVHEP